MILRLTKVDGKQVYIPVWEIRRFEPVPNTKQSMLWLKNEEYPDNVLYVQESSETIQEWIDKYFQVCYGR